MYAILSDIHANLEALEAVLADLQRQGVQRIVCLGDIVGYGPNPRECLRLVRTRCAWSLRGNHDIATLLEPFGFNKSAHDAAVWTRKQLEPGWLSGKQARLDWALLEEAEESRTEDGILYVHASPRDPVMEYVEEADCLDMGFGPGDKIQAIMAEVPRFCFVGHTHRPGVITEALRFHRPGDIDGIWHLDGGRALINVGSVGQPRDGNPDARYVLIDGEVVRFCAVSYDREKTAAKIRAIPELDNRLASRLLEGV